MLIVDAIGVENLRGYEHTKFALKPLTVLVGENNEGKSSSLKMLEKFLSIPDDFWNGDRFLDGEEFDFWYPANNAQHQARRFTLYIKFLDGRSSRPFNAVKGQVVPLRFAVTSTGICRLNLGRPKRGEVHDAAAQALHRLVKEKVTLVFLPPIRDASSSTFTDKVAKNAKSILREKLAHNKRAGAPKEYRLAIKAIEHIEEIVSSHRAELAKSKDSPLSSMLKASEVRVELFPRDIYRLIESSMHVYLSTGEHDELKVLPSEVGNGLQSLIDINLTIDDLASAKDSKSTILIVEEPESFLHPSAQRQFMQYLRGVLQNKIASTILTTHSPIILDEAFYEEIVLVRNQTHYEPTITDKTRASINTSLMTTASSEIFFARSIVLVEGEGDRAFFNTLIRRIKKATRASPELSGLVFQVTGGCRAYSPWLKLIRSYKFMGQQPFQCFWIMDGDAAFNSDGQRPVLKASDECDFGLTAENKQSIAEFGDLGWNDIQRTPDCAKTANHILNPHGGSLFACDFEWALFNGVSPAGLKSIRAALGSAGINTVGTKVELAKRLGSKIGNGKTSDGAKKNPYIRTLIAEKIDLKLLPPEIYVMLHRILLVAYETNARVQTLMNQVGISKG